MTVIWDVMWVAPRTQDIKNMWFSAQVNRTLPCSCFIWVILVLAAEICAQDMDFYTAIFPRMELDMSEIELLCVSGKFNRTSTNPMSHNHTTAAACFFVFFWDESIPAFSELSCSSPSQTTIIGLSSFAYSFCSLVCPLIFKIILSPHL